MNIEQLTLWRAGRFTFDLSVRPLIMGIVNVTPDSFSDGARHASTDAATAHGEALLAQGADILDIGGESTRPGAIAVDAVTEWQRIGDVVRHFQARGACVSVDTMKPEVMRKALDAGADIINDVRALQEPGALEIVAPSACGLVLMHMRGTPGTMQAAPVYENVVAQVADFFVARVAALEASGICRERIVLDPGFGFGKTLDHNLVLLAQIGALGRGIPVLAGLSRKSMLGKLTGKEPGDRLVASVAAALLAVQRGARVVRVHDVCATVDAFRVWAAVESAAKQD